MKKTLFSLFAALALCACESSVDAPCPVTGIELPASSASAPVMPGETVTIRGVGFEPDCTVALHSGDSSVQAEVLEVTASALSFRAPILSGRQRVVLTQSGGSWNLGELVFPRPEELPLDILPRRISHVRVTETDCEDGQLYQTYTIRYAYDAQGRIVEIRETDMQYIYEGAPADQIWDDVVTTVEYAADRIIATEAGERTVFELTDGLTKKMTIGFGSGGTEEYFAFTYSTEGYLTACAFSTSDGDSDRTTYTVVDGSRVKQEVISNGDSWSMVFENSPTQLNNLNIDLFGIISFNNDGSHMLYRFGVGGCRLRTLPVKVIDDGYTVCYRYTMDGDYISKIEEFDEEEEGTTLSLEIFYEE